MVQHNNYHHGDLKKALIQGGMAILLSDGLEKLTLRKVAKFCNVSHNAPYRSFKNKEEFLVALGQEIFTELTSDIFKIIENTDGNPDTDFEKMMTTFYEYAINNPTKYRFVAGNFFSQEGKHVHLTGVVTSAFISVRNFLEQHRKAKNFHHLDSDSMAIMCISTMHGFCSIVIDNKFDLLKIGPINYKN